MQFEKVNLMVIMHGHRDAFKASSYGVETAHGDKAPFGTKYSSWLVAIIRSHGKILHWHPSGTQRYHKVFAVRPPATDMNYLRRLRSSCDQDFWGHQVLLQ